MIAGAARFLEPLSYPDYLSLDAAARLLFSSRDSSRSRSRSILRRTSSLISPRFRMPTSCSRWASYRSYISRHASARPRTRRRPRPRRGAGAGSRASSCALDAFRPDPVGLAELLDPGDPGLGDELPRDALLSLFDSVVLEAEPRDDRAEREPLADQRHQDHAEGQEYDQRAIGKLTSGVDGGMARGRRARPSRASQPSRWRAALPAAPARALAVLAVRHLDGVRDQEHTAGGRRSRRRSQEAPPHELAGRGAREVVEYARELEAHEQEEQPIQEEGEDLPDGHALKAHEWS